MSKIEKIIIKENQEVKEIERKKYINNFSFLTISDKCFLNIINPQNIQNRKNFKKFKTFISIMLSYMHVRNKKDIVENTFNYLLNSKTKNDIENAINYYINEFIKLNEISINKIYGGIKVNANKYIETAEELIYYLKVDFDLVSSIFIKKFLTYYFRCKLLQLRKTNIEEIYINRVNGVKIKEFIKVLNIEFTQDSKDNGLYLLSEKLINDLINDIYDLQQNHLCNSCLNAYVSKCPKIKYGNLPLDSYEFVEKGFQIMSEEKPIIFVVSDCKKYEKDTRIYANDSVKKLEKKK